MCFGLGVCGMQQPPQGAVASAAPSGGPASASHAGGVLAQDVGLEVPLNPDTHTAVNALPSPRCS